MEKMISLHNELHSINNNYKFILPYFQKVGAGKDGETVIFLAYIDEIFWEMLEARISLNR